MKTQTIKEILEALNEASYGTKSFNELPQPEQDMIVYKIQLK